MVWSEGAPEAVIIDSVLDYDHSSGRTSTHAADALLEVVHQHQLKVAWILETHAHADHLSGAPYLKRMTGAPIGIGEHIQDVQTVFKPIFAAEDVSGTGAEFDRLWKDGETFAARDLEIEVIHTPGHTPACVSYKIGDALFVGDTLFMPDYGTARCDFPGGNARTLYASIQRLLTLPDETRVFLCHDYLPQGRDEYVWQTTIKAEREHNIHIGGDATEDEFVTMREGRDQTLSMPRLLLPSVQVNIRAGQLPPEDDKGRVFLKLPVDAL